MPVSPPLRTTLVAIGLGGLGWLLFLAVASVATGAGAAVAADVRALYAAEWGFAVTVFARNLALCGALWVVALLVTRRGAPGARALCAGAAVLLVAVWSARAGLAAAGIGVGEDRTALALATAPHTAAELGLIVLPLVAAARGHRVDHRWPAVAAAGLALCAVLEAFI